MCAKNLHEALRVQKANAGSCKCDEMTGTKKLLQDLPFK